MLLFASAIAVASVCRAQPESAGENAIKAAFLFKFCGYIEWPGSTLASDDAPIVFGILGADEVADNLTQMVAGRTVAGHPVTVRKLLPGDSISGLNVLFVGGPTNSLSDNVLAISSDLPVLTVTESENWNASDSTINFVVIGDKVRFDVSLKAASRSNIKISTRLLSVARHVVASSS